jgi:heme A synthase
MGDAGTPAAASETAEITWLTWVRTVVGLLGLAVALAAVYAWRRDRVRR